MAGGWVYIMTNRPNGMLYVGVTADIARRAWEHREGVVHGFTKKYGLKRLVFVERHDVIEQAIQREKSIKRWPRAWKVNLILTHNPHWDDLFETLQCQASSFGKNKFVMPALVAGIHVPAVRDPATWMVGTSPTMTVCR